MIGVVEGAAEEDVFGRRREARFESDTQEVGVVVDLGARISNSGGGAGDAEIIDEDLRLDGGDSEFGFDELGVADEDFHDGLHDFDGRSDSHWKACHLEEATSGVDETEPAASGARNFKLVETRFGVSGGSALVSDVVKVEGDVTEIRFAGVAALKEVVVALGPVDEAEAIDHGAVIFDF